MFSATVTQTSEIILSLAHGERKLTQNKNKKKLQITQSNAVKTIQTGKLDKSGGIVQRKLLPPLVSAYGIIKHTGNTRPPNSQHITVTPGNIPPHCNSQPNNGITDLMDVA